MPPQEPHRRKVEEFLNPKQKKSWLGKIFLPLRQRILGMRIKLNQPQYRRNVFFTGFLIVSCYFSWKMQEKADQMKARSVRSMTIKQELQQKEAEYLDNMLLRKTRVSNRQIQDIPDVQKKYRFEDYDDDELTTRSELVQRMYEDYLRGIQPPADYRREVMEHASLIDDINRGQRM